MDSNYQVLPKLEDMELRQLKAVSPEVRARMITDMVDELCVEQRIELTGSERIEAVHFMVSAIEEQITNL